jgi:hypothetical protein
METKLSIGITWEPSGGKYQAVWQKYQTKRKIALLQKIHEGAVEYKFIQNLNGKYGVSIIIKFNCVCLNTSFVMFDQILLLRYASQW